MNKIEAFKNEIIEVCKKHQMSILHEDYHGAFEIVPYSVEHEKWFYHASVEMPNFIKVYHNDHTKIKNCLVGGICKIGGVVYEKIEEKNIIEINHIIHECIFISRSNNKHYRYTFIVYNKDECRYEEYMNEVMGIPVKSIRWDNV
jgi:hypothetical protein